MLPTWVHGVVDYTAATLLGALSMRGNLSPTVRAICGGAGLAHAGYSVVTDYEAGVKPILGMKQHLKLDGLGAVGLCAAGLLMREQRPRERALLLGLGVFELLAVAASSDQPVSGPGQLGGPLARLSERLTAARRSVS